MTNITVPTRVVVTGELLCVINNINTQFKKGVAFIFKALLSLLKDLIKEFILVINSYRVLYKSLILKLLVLLFICLVINIKDFRILISRSTYC